MLPSLYNKGTANTLYDTASYMYNIIDQVLSKWNTETLHDGNPKSVLPNPASYVIGSVVVSE